MTGARAPVWLFDLDDTLHDASTASFPALHVAMGAYIETHLGLAGADASALRHRYWKRYGATLLGLVRHHAVDAAHFLEERTASRTSRRGSSPTRATAPRWPGSPVASSSSPTRRVRMRCGCCARSGGCACSTA